MANSGPGRHDRAGISLIELFRLFPDNATAEQWCIAQRLPDGICCHYCGSENVQTNAKHKTMPFTGAARSSAGSGSASAPARSCSRPSSGSRSGPSHTYQPTKAEIEEPITLPAGTTGEDLLRAAVTPVRVVEQD